MFHVDDMCDTLGAMTESLIGSAYSIKCITDEENAIFVNCIHRLLQNVHIQNRIADLIIEAVSVHHKCYTCSCKTLLTLILIWSKVIGKLKKQDIPLPLVLRMFHEAVWYAVDLASDIAMKPKDVLTPVNICKVEAVAKSTSAPIDSLLHSDDEEFMLREGENVLKQKKPVFVSETNTGESLDLKELSSSHSVLGDPALQSLLCTLSSRTPIQSIPETVRRGTLVSNDNHLVDDEDDVSWFFEDDSTTLSNVCNNQKDDLDDKSVQNITDPSRLDATRLEFSDLQIEPCHSTLQCQVVDQSVMEPVNKDGKTDISSLCDSVDNDDEFASCFDGAQQDSADWKLETSIVSRDLTTVSCGVFGNDLNDPHGGEHEDENLKLQCSFKRLPLPKQFAGDLAQNELGSQATIAQNELGSQATIAQNELGSQATIAQNELGSQATIAQNELGSQDTIAQNDSVRHLENKLQEILKNSKAALKAKVFNRCRHFKTITSTVNELQQAQQRERQLDGWKVVGINSAHQDQRIRNVKPLTDKPDVELLNECQISAAESEDQISDQPKQSVAIKPLESIKAKMPLNQNGKGVFEKRSQSCKSGSCSSNEQTDERYSLLLKLTKVLSHGADEVVPLVTDVCWKQMKEKKSSLLSSIKTSCIHTHTVVGPVWEHSSSLEGAVLNVSSTQLTVLSRRSGPYRGLLIHGDLQLSYKHKGQQIKQRKVTIEKRPLAESNEAVWLKELKSLIRQFSIQVLLISGLASDSVYDLCDDLDVVVLTGVPYSLLVTLGESYQVGYVKYITETTKDNVLYPLIVNPYDSDWKDKITASCCSAMVVIRTSTTLLQTCVICHPCKNVAMLREEQFWHCIKRVAACIHGNKMLPGGGGTELSCAVHLRRKAGELEAGDNTGVSYDALIYCAVAEGFEQFASVVTRNSLLDNNSDIISDVQDLDSRVFDDLESKVEAWQTACHVTCQLLLADAEVTTGLDNLDKRVVL